MKAPGYLKAALVLVLLAGCGDKQGEPTATKSPAPPPTKGPADVPPPKTTGPADVKAPAVPASKYAAIPADKAQAIRAAEGFPCFHSWDRRVSLLFGASPREGEDNIPSVMLAVDQGKKFPALPDAGVPFVLRLHDKGVKNEAMKEVAKLPNLIGVVLIGTGVTDDGVKELAGHKKLKYLGVLLSDPPGGIPMARQRSGTDTPLTDATLGHLAACPQLEGLDLADCAITDAGLKKIAGLKELQYLNLKSTQVTAASLPVIAGLKNLTHLSLYSCQVGNDLSALAKLPKLTHLNLHSGSAGDDGVKSLKGLDTLIDLDVGAAGASDETIKVCKQFPKLAYLAMSASGITDDGLKEVKNLPSLTTLDVQINSRLTDAGIASLKDASKLQRLDLFALEAVTDKGLAELAQIKTLTWLQLAGTKVTKAGVEAFQKQLPKCQVYGAPS
jgi:hypothetical protein